MKIALGCDHGGYLYKEEVKKFLISKGCEVFDAGCYSTERANYAKHALDAAILVSNHTCDFGIVICTSGEGVSIAANKVKGIRCGIGYNDDVAHLLREHNNANMIAFGAKFQSLADVKKRIDLFLNASFEGGRHLERVETIINFENK